MAARIAHGKRWRWLADCQCWRLEFGWRGYIGWHAEKRREVNNNAFAGTSVPAITHSETALQRCACNNAYSYTIHHQQSLYQLNIQGIHTIST